MKNYLGLSLTRWVAATACALTLTVSSQAASLTIDSLETAIDLPDGELLVDSMVGANNTRIQNAVVGTLDTARRTAYVEVAADNGSAGEVILAIPGSPANFASLASGSNTAGLWELTYDNFTGTTADISGFLRVEVGYFADTNVFLRATLTLTDTDSSDALTVTGSPSGNTISFPYYLYSGIDFAALEEIKLTFEGVNSVGDPRLQGDYLITSIVAIPEPASVMLIAAGSGLMLLRRRR